MSGEGYNPVQGYEDDTSTVEPISQDNWLDRLQQMANYGDKSALDRLMTYFMSEGSAQTARDWTASREDSAVERMITQFRNAGINPYYALQQMNPIVSSSSGNTYSGAFSSNSSNKQEQNASRWAQIISSIVTGITVAMIAAA